MKNFKKLLVTLLALVLMVCAVTVVSLAAGTPAEIIAEAQVLLDRAADDGEFIAVRSQKMRELDKLIDSNLASIRNSQEWRDFQVGYRAAQNKLKEDCVVAANESLEQLLVRDITAAEASAIYSGLSQLISLSGDGRGYFDTTSDAYTALTVRMKVAEAIAKLQTAEDSVVAKDKGAALLWVNTYKDLYLAENAEVQALDEYKMMNAWFDEMYDSIDETLFAEIRALTDEACLSATTFERGLVIADEIESYFNNCYFNKADGNYGAIRLYSYFAKAHVYLNEIERSKALITKGMHLKTLVELNGTTVFDTASDIYADYKARYDALLNTEDPDSVVSLLCELAEGYKKDVADVFTNDYAGPLTSAKAIQDVVDELDGLIATCYFSATTYRADLAVAQAYAKIYDFYVAMQELESAPEKFVERNGLYKAAVTSYNSLSGQIFTATDAYKNPFIALYMDLIADASTEIRYILDGWLITAQESKLTAEDGTYMQTLEDVKAAYDNLQFYYIDKANALYYSATEDKTLTSKVKIACQSVEERMLDEFTKLLAVAKNLVEIPEDLATIDIEGLAARDAAIENLLALTDGLTFVYADAMALDALLHDLYVSKMLTLLCELEVEYAKPEGMDAAVAIYNELKTFTSEHMEKIVVEAEDYLAYALLLNKIEVKMGDSNVPGAQPYLEALEAVVDNDNFDKVYALMHLDEYIRNNKIVHPDPSDTTSASALFYQKYDELAGKVAAWRKAIADAREATVPMGDYASTSVNEYDADTKQTTATASAHTYTQRDGREYGANGSAYYMTLEYTKGSTADGYISATFPSKTENIIIEMDITTFTTWPSGGVSFNSGTNGLDTGTRLYPWIGGIDGAGQIVAPKGNTHGWGAVLTNREGGYIIPGQWTHFVIVYNAKEKMVSYYVNDEKIVDASGKDRWSCALSEAFDFSEPLRIGNSNSGGGSFSVDNVRLYVGNQPRNIHFFNDMSALEKFAYYTNYVKDYVDSNGAAGSAADAKASYDEILSLSALYWGFKNEGDTEKTYLFDETTYWNTSAPNYVDPGITYTDFVAVVDNFVYIAANANTIIEGAMIEAVFNNIKDMVAKLETLTGIANLITRTSTLADLNAYIEANVDYINQFDSAKAELYDSYLEKIELINGEIEAYGRANEYIQMVNKFAAARDLYSRTVYRAQAESMMKAMETDAALGYFDLDLIKEEVLEFSEAIVVFEEQSRLLDAAVKQDNNEIIIDCMGRFPATPEEAIKNYSYLNKYIVLVRRILLEGNYNPNDLEVQDALVIYEKMNTLFYDALQRDHAAYVQDLIDQYNAETSYIARLGIYNAVKAYLEDNKDTIDGAHDSIKGIYSQYEIMDLQFGSEEGKEEQWQEYGKILEANALKFANLVVQMRFSSSYEELRSLREQAAALYYYMDSSTADAQLAVEYYHTYEKLLTQKALNSDLFIDAAYALKKASGMKETYFALVAAKAAFALADVTYDGAVTYYEKIEGVEYAVVFSMAEAVELYEIALAQYNSFVTVTNSEINVVLDIVCAVRATFPVNQPIVALFKKYYD